MATNDNESPGALATGVSSAIGWLKGAIGGGTTGGIALAAIGAAIGAGVQAAAPYIPGTALATYIPDVIAAAEANGGWMSVGGGAALGATVGGAIGVAGGAVGGGFFGAKQAVDNRQTDDKELVNAIEKQQALAQGLVQGATLAKMELEQEKSTQWQDKVGGPRPQELSQVNQLNQRKNVSLATLDPVGRA